MVDAKAPYWNEMAETMGSEDKVRLYEEIIPVRVEKAYREAGLYRKLWDSVGVSPGKISTPGDLGQLPFVTKEMVRDFRQEYRDAFGGLALPPSPGSMITRSTGSSGEPTFFVTSQSDIERAADEVATYFWQMGHRPGSIVMTGPATGTRVDGPNTRAHELLDLVCVIASPANLDVFISQLEYLKPEAMSLTTGTLDGLLERSAQLGKDFELLVASIKRVTYGGRRLLAHERVRLADAFDAEVYEVGGLGDIGLWGSDCAAHDGIHVRDDYFFIETVDPDTGESLGSDEPGELVYTSLWEESMNYVRWRSEDLGILVHGLCACGRTTPRLSVFGRVWERFSAGDKMLLPGDVEAVLFGVIEREPVFQLVVRGATQELLAIDLARSDSLDIAEIKSTLFEHLGISVPIRLVEEQEIRAGSPGYKYRQVVTA